MEKKRRAAPGCGVLGEGSPEGCRLHCWPRRGPGRMGRRQTSNCSGTMGRDQAPARRDYKVSRKISSPVIYINHWRWLEANGYKKEAASGKRQA